DFALAVTAHCQEPDLACLYGLVFRRLGGSPGSQMEAGYRFTVEPSTRRVALAYWAPGEPPGRERPLIGPTRTTAVRPGGAENRIAVLAQGDRLQLFVNGMLVGEAQAPERAWGQVGCWAETLAGGRPQAALFENLALATLGPLDTLAPI